MSKTRFCEICKQPIEEERLEGSPETRLCIEHGKAIQSFGGEFIMRGTQSNLSKTGSLKKNYGDVSIERERNDAAMAKLRAEYGRRAGA